jgi:hypothetical protein
MGLTYRCPPLAKGTMKRYLVHIIVKHLLEQKGTFQDVGKAFQVVVEVKKQMEQLLEIQEGKTETEKDEQRKVL